MKYYTFCGNNIELIKKLENNSVHSIVTDPPYGLKFMNKTWDYDVPNIEIWKECLRVLKPGGYLLAFFGTRTYHRGVIPIEDAGFEIRDCISWVYGSGFPKSHNISKAIDEKAGVERKVVGVKPGHEQFANRGNLSSVQSLKGTLGGEGGFARPWMEDPEKVEKYHMLTAPNTEEAKQWDGWGTALKPACEFIVMARKPIEGTVAENILKYGAGGLNIDDCRIEGKPWKSHEATGLAKTKFFTDGETPIIKKDPHSLGRFPANLIHDGSQEVLDLFPNTGKSTGGQASLGAFRNGDIFGKGQDIRESKDPGYGDSGSAARFFYCAKASKKDREEGNKHPTVKPTDLMRYLCRLVTAPNGIILDPFMGSGSTGKAAILEGFNFIGFELNQEYVNIANSRIERVLKLAKQSNI